jgi:hypothetical protein
MYLTLEGAMVLLAVSVAIPLVHAVILLFDGVRGLLRRLRKRRPPTAIPQAGRAHDTASGSRLPALRPQRTTCCSSRG